MQVLVIMMDLSLIGVISVYSGVILLTEVMVFHTIFLQQVQVILKKLTFVIMIDVSVEFLFVVLGMNMWYNVQREKNM